MRSERWTVSRFLVHAPAEQGHDMLKAFSIVGRLAPSTADQKPTSPRSFQPAIRLCGRTTRARAPRFDCFEKQSKENQMASVPFTGLENAMLKSLLQSIVGRFAPTIPTVVDTAVSNVPVHVPTIADHVHSRRRGQLDQSVHDCIAIARFNGWHARAGTGIRAEPIGTPSNPVEISAEEALAGASENAGEGSALADAEEFLRTELANGERTVKSLKASAIAAGVAWRTIERAKGRLAVKAGKSRAPHGGWVWTMSGCTGAEPEGRQDRQHRHSGMSRNDGGLEQNGQHRQGVLSEIRGVVGGLGENLNDHAADDSGDRSTVHASPLPIWRR